MFSKKKCCDVLLLICFIIALIPMVYFSFQKDGLFCDELWTYGIANSVGRYALVPNELSNNDVSNIEWVDGKIFSDYLEVNSGEQFNYKAVMENAKVDSHPALYYYLLHTICSFFPDTFSVWYGLILNLIIYIIALIYLFKLSLLMYSRPWAQIVPLIWALSAAGINTVIFVRMYMLVTLCIIMFTYYFWQFMCEEKFTKGNYIGLTITIVVGILSEFAVLTYLGVVAAFYLCYLFLQKKYKKCFQIILTAIIAIIIAISIYPVFFQSLLGNLAGKEGYLNFGANIKNKSQNIAIFFNHINHMLFGGYFFFVIAFMIFLLVVVITCCFWRISFCVENRHVTISFFKQEQKNSITISIQQIAMFITGIAVMISFVMISRASNMNDNYGARVLYPLCPIIIMIIYYIFSQFAQLLKSSKRFQLFMICIGLIISVVSISDFGILWLFPGQEEMIASTNIDRGKDCIYLYSKYTWNDLYAPSRILENYDEICFIAIEDLNQDLIPVLANRKSKDEILLGFLTNIVDNTNTNFILDSISMNLSCDIVYKYSLPYLSSDTAIVFYQLVMLN